MSYLILARKWRPQTFEEVVGQQIITKTLANAIRQNRVAHALLFCGPRGVGKTSVARILAKAMNCEKGPTPNPCGVCTACREITQGTSLDIHEIDGASNRGIDEIRKLKETVMYMPVSLKTKVIIIDEVHMLTKEAFNALLKTLEEPPEHVIFILATTEPHKIPPTILSRCQRYDFRRVPFRLMVSHLKKIVEQEKFEADEEALMLVAREATGSLRDAEVVLDQLLLISKDRKITIEDARSVLSVVDSTVMLKTIDCIVRKASEELLALVSQLVDAGTDLAYFYRSFLLFLHDLLLLKAAGDRDVVMERGEEEIRQMREMIRSVPIEQIEQWIQIFHDRERFVLQSEYSRIGLELALVQMIHLNQAVSVDALIKRLESKLGGKEVESTVVGGGLKREVAEKKPSQYLESMEDYEKPVMPDKGVHERAELNSFDSFLRFAKKKAMSLSAQLADASGFRWRGATVEIMFPVGSFSMKLIQSPEKEKKLKALLEEYSGREITRIIFKEGEIGNSVGGEPYAAMGKGSTRGKLTEHPAVKDTLRILGGRLVEIKPIEKK